MARALEQLAEGVHYLPGAVNSLIVEGADGQAVIIDSGLDQGQARQIAKALSSLGLRPGALLNTHSHADHCGGNAELLERYPDIQIYAPPLEAELIRCSELEPVYLYGARPPGELRNKHLQAQPRPAEPIGPGRQRLAGRELELIPCPGHALNQYAVRIAGVLYAADGLFGPQVLAKHPLCFCQDSALQKRSAAELGDLQGVRLVLPGHGDPSADLSGLAEENLRHFQETSARILRCCEQPKSAEAIVAELSSASSLPLWYLDRSTVLAHLSELISLERVDWKLSGVPVFCLRLP